MAKDTSAEARGGTDVIGRGDMILKTKMKRGGERGIDQAGTERKMMIGLRNTDQDETKMATRDARNIAHGEPWMTKIVRMVNEGQTAIANLKMNTVADGMTTANTGGIDLWTRRQVVATIRGKANALAVIEKPVERSSTTTLMGYCSQNTCETSML